MSAVMHPDTLMSMAVPLSDAAILSGSGVYVIYAAQPNCLPIVPSGTSSALYVGMTEDGLDARNHFYHRHSGFSTLRRSLGALLKQKLSLVAEPRSLGASRSNAVNYRFSNERERALSHWMTINLVLAQMECGKDTGVIEKQLILVLQPALNLVGWNNPYRASIKALRAACVGEAANKLWRE